MLPPSAVRPFVVKQIRLASNRVNINIKDFNIKALFGRGKKIVFFNFKGDFPIGNSVSNVCDYIPKLTSLKLIFLIFF